MKKSILYFVASLLTIFLMLDMGMVHAEETAIVYQVSYDLNGGDESNWPYKPFEYAEGEYVEAPYSVPAREGYRFVGWYADGEPFDFNVLHYKDIVLTAMWEEKTVLSGTCGQNITFVLDKGVLTLTGSGEMYDYYETVKDPDWDMWYPSSKAPWYPYRDEITELYLDDNITKIGSGAFVHLGVSNTISGEPFTVILPSKLKIVGEHAFYETANFNIDMDFPEGLTRIETAAFMSSRAADTERGVVLPAGLTYLGMDSLCQIDLYRKNLYVKGKNTPIENAFSWNSWEQPQRIYGLKDSLAQKTAAKYEVFFLEWDFANPPQYYTVTFDTKGGTAVEAQQVDVAGYVIKPTAPVKNGYYFQYWSLNGERYDFEAPVGRNFTLTAVWSDRDPAMEAMKISFDNGNYNNKIIIWDERADADLICYEIYRAKDSNGVFELIGTAEPEETCYYDDSPMSYAKTKYRYYVQAVYERDGAEVRTPASNEVSCRGLIYDELPDDFEEAYIGDAEGNRLDKITLHVGETSPELTIWIKYADGSIISLGEIARWDCIHSGYDSVVFDWAISDAESDEDVLYMTTNDQGIYARYVTDYMSVTYEDAEYGKVRYKGREVTPTTTKFYLCIEANWGMFFGAIIPIEVLPAEEGVTYEYFADELKVNTTMDEFWEEVRCGFRNKEENFKVYLDWDTYVDNYTVMDGGYPYQIDMFPELDEKAFDFYYDREGMLPGDGDYLQQSIEYRSVFENDVQYYGEECHVMLFPVVRYFYTPEQEEVVTKRVHEMIYEPGGELYPYKDASDYAKIKAIYDYVSNHITWVTGKPIYHMAYSGLIDGKGTCQSYALLFYRLAREMGISNKVLMGTDPGAHTYNIVKLGSKYYYIDCSDKRFLMGNDNFKKTTLQNQWRDPLFQQNFMDKISKADYGGNKASVIKSVTALSDEQLFATDENLLQVADKMAATYALKGNTFSVVSINKAGIQSVMGCSSYLGAKENLPKEEAGYFLAFRVTVDSTKMQADGQMTISYLHNNEKLSEIFTTENSSLKDGYVDVILNVSGEVKGLSISIDFDTNGDDSEYQEKMYTLNTDKLVKVADSGFGKVSELSEAGVVESYPLIAKKNSGKDINVFYDAVAYATALEIEGVEDTEGYYGALRIAVPESLKGTARLQNTENTVCTTIASDNLTMPFYYKVAEGGIYADVFYPLEKGTSGDFTICWAGAMTQKFHVEVPLTCRFEKTDPNAKLPKSIKFNGLSKTMYVGQEQTVDASIVKKYENDLIQLTFTSSDSSVLRVDRITGKLTALCPGKATITVSAVDENGETAKGAFLSAAITVKAPTVISGIKFMEQKDISTVVNWKQNPTGQQVEIYALEWNQETLGTKASDWKKNIENALQKIEMGEKMLSDLTAIERQVLEESLCEEFEIESCVLAETSVDENAMSVTGLKESTKYIFYLRNTVLTETGELYFAGVTSQVQTKPKVLTTVRLYAMDASGEELAPNFIIRNDSLADGPSQISYETDAEYTKVTYKSTDSKVISVDKYGKLKLGGQAGIAQLYVTGKDSSGAVRESDRIKITVIKTPTALADKTTTLALGGSVKLKDLINYNIKGQTTELNLDSVDFEFVLDAIRATDCFTITDSQSGKTEDVFITAKKFLPDTNGNVKSGNSIKIPVSVYKDTVHAEGETPVSTKNAIIKVNDMTLPVVTKVVSMDTSATVKFKPNTTVTEPAGENYYYTAVVTDTTTKKEIPVSYTITEGADSTAKSPLYTCEITGLFGLRNYEVVITAHYKTSDVMISKASKAKAFKTLKPLVEQKEINYISLDELRKNPNSSGNVMDFTDEKGIVLYNNETYVFMMQVSRLDRIQGADKLKWSITDASVKNPASVKASSDTYQAQLITMRTGTFMVTVTSTVSKQVVASFNVTVLPYQSNQ